jgi:15-cis-phytoene synthase
MGKGATSKRRSSSEGKSMKQLPWITTLTSSQSLKDPIGFLAQNSRSFRFAARFLPEKEARQVAEVYAYCRLTDNLVDEADGVEIAELEERLQEWEALSRKAYAGNSTGITILDIPLGHMGEQGVPFTYAAELIEGMRMDIRPRLYANLGELEVYTYRVAGVVGQWLTELVGVKNPWVLARAADLGHAMQLTNILRDVGEDRNRGRLYLPIDALVRHGFDPENFAASWAGKSLPPPAYGHLMEELMAVSERRYRMAFQGIPSLPGFFQRPSLVSALVYREIHTALRKNRYDNFRLRAHSSTFAKLGLGLRSMWILPFIRNLFPAMKIPVQEGGMAYVN